MFKYRLMRSIFRFSFFIIFILFLKVNCIINGKQRKLSDIHSKTVSIYREKYIRSLGQVIYSFPAGRKSGKIDHVYYFIYISAGIYSQIVKYMNPGSNGR